MTLKPLRNVVVMEPVKESETTKSGIIIPGEKKALKPKVVAVGPDVKELKVGDEVFFKQYGPEELTIEDTSYLVCDETDVVAKHG